MPLLFMLTLNQPMSSPQMMRIFGLYVFGIFASLFFSWHSSWACGQLSEPPSRSSLNQRDGHGMSRLKRSPFIGNGPKQAAGARARGN
jgi:hypothetical protein